MVGNNVFFAEKNISDVKNSSYERISVLGKVISSDKSSFMLDDSTGTINVCGTVAEEKNVVRVFGTVNRNILNAEIVQDMSELDVILFNKMKKSEQHCLSE